MSLFLEVLDGDLQGTRYPVQSGLVIGRRNADITLRDSRVSGRHAKVVVRPEGGFSLVDQGSSNGIKVSGVRVQELILTDGVTFMIGRTSFRVMALATDSTEPEIVIEAPPPKTWWDQLQELAQRGTQSRVNRQPLVPFQPVIHLQFIQGVQTGTEWTLGYGPREIGPESLDLSLEELGLTGVCFRLTPHHQGALFENLQGRKVRINGESIDRKLLEDGDIIEIRSTRIRVAFALEDEHERNQ